MTIAEKLRNEGMLAGRRDALARMIEKKFGLSEEERGSIDSVDNLDRLADALDEILFAQSKQHVLDKLKP